MTAPSANPSIRVIIERRRTQPFSLTRYFALDDESRLDTEFGHYPGTVPVSSAMEPPVLNSWKEIAEYFGRGVRTAQRWERELGLPVHRPHNHRRSPVMAIRSEIDKWLRRTADRELKSSPSVLADFHRNWQTLIASTDELQRRTVELRHNLVRILDSAKQSPIRRGTISKRE